MYLTSKSRIKNMKKLHLLHSDYFQKIYYSVSSYIFFSKPGRNGNPYIATTLRNYKIISGKSFLWFCFCKYKSFYFSQYKYHSKKLAFIKIESFLRIIYELQLKILPSRWNEKHKQPTDTRLT